MCDVDLNIPNEIPKLKDLESLLRCGICFRYMKTSMVTACSHNYCSICIRQTLIYKTQCPACYEETYDYQLRNNRVLDAIIEIFFKLSEEVNAYIHDHRKPTSQNKLPKEDLVQNHIVTDINKEHEDIPAVQVKKDKVSVASVSNLFNNPSTSYFDPESVENEDLVINDGNFMKSEEIATKLLHKSSDSKSKSSNVELQIPSIFSPKRKTIVHLQNVNLVPCPVCDVKIPEKNINLHLDDCLKRSEQPKPNSSAKPQKRRPLPKLVYALLQDKELKKKLKELGLSIQGERKAWITRHQRFTVLYNSECDALNPRPNSELIKQLEKDEQEEKKASAAVPPISNVMKIDRKTDPKVIEEVQKQYLQQNKSSFESLIQSIRNRQVPKKQAEKQNCAIEEEVDISQENETDDLIPNRSFRKNIIISDDEDSSSEKEPTNMSKINETLSEDNAEEENVNFDDSSVGSLSPVLGRNTTVNCKKKESDKDMTLTPDMFQQSASSTGTHDENCDFLQQKTSESGVNKNEENSDLDSNHSFSLLAEFTQESPITCGQENSTVEVETQGRKRLPKRINSQLEDPDFEPDFEDMSEDFVVSKPSPRRKSTKKMPTLPSVVDTGERRVLRKRVKR